MEAIMEKDRRQCGAPRSRRKLYYKKFDFTSCGCGSGEVKTSVK
jgi:hypothetical protein